MSKEKELKLIKFDINESNNFIHTVKTKYN
jgi:hypothetical protein